MKISRKKIFLAGLLLLFIVSLLNYFDFSAQKDLNPIKIDNKLGLNSTQDTTFSFSHNGIQRRYSVHLPPITKGSVKLPLVIIFHGGGSNIEEVKETLGWDKTADTKGFIAAYPEATGKKFFEKHLGVWNAGKCCNPAFKEMVDDIGFIKKMINSIKNEYPVDTQKVYVTGISNGSMMAITTACENASQITAIGTVAGPGQYNHCSLEKPVPLIYFQGTEDNCVPYDGGVTEGCYDLFFKELLGFNLHGDKITLDTAENFVAKWKSMNHTNALSKTTSLGDTATCTSAGYQTSSEVVFCKIKGMGHTWPGQLNYGTACEKGLNDSGCKATIKVLGKLNKDIHANEIMWDFFSRHSSAK